MKTWNIAGVGLHLASKQRSTRSLAVLDVAHRLLVTVLLHSPRKLVLLEHVFFCSESTTTYPGVAESHVFFPEKKHLLALLCVIQGMNVSHHSDPVRGADGAVSWVHGFHRSGCVVPSWQSPRFFSKAFLMLRDPLKQSLGDVDLSIANGDKQCPSNSGILHHDVT